MNPAALLDTTIYGAQLSPDYLKPSTTPSIQPTIDISEILTIEEKIRKFNNELFDGLSKLKQGWDGYQGKAFDLGFVNQIRHFVESISYPPMVFAGGNGQLQLEFRKDGNNYTEIEVSSEGIEIFRMENGHPFEEQIRPISELQKTLQEYQFNYQNS